MQREADAADAGMAAVLKLSDEAVTKLCMEFNEVYPVNFNSDEQVVVAAAKNELGSFMTRVKESGGKALPLKVGGGFHSKFMSGAATDFSEALDEISIAAPKLPLYSNVTAKPYGTDIRELLTRQIYSPVLWRETVENMISDGADTFVEAGVGKTLSGLITRISDKVRVFNAEDIKSLEMTINGCKAQ